MAMQNFMNGRVEVGVGDITKERVDAIVNAANSSLMGGGGVDGAIHAAGGPAIVEECKIIRKERCPNGLPTGEAIITTGGRLEPRIIHTVGPVYSRAKNPGQLLANCYANSLKIAIENGCQTIAFPAISTGVYGYPKKKAAKVASKAISEFLASHSEIHKVRLVFFSQPDAELFIANCKFM